MGGSDVGFYLAFRLSMHPRLASQLGHSSLWSRHRHRADPNEGEPRPAQCRFPRKHKTATARDKNCVTDDLGWHAPGPFSIGQ